MTSVTSRDNEHAITGPGAYRPALGFFLPARSPPAPRWIAVGALARPAHATLALCRRLRFLVPPVFNNQTIVRVVRLIAVAEAPASAAQQ